MRVIRPSSTVTLTTVSSPPATSIRAAGAPLSHTVAISNADTNRWKPEHRRDPLGAVDRGLDGGDQPTTVGDHYDVGRHDLHELLQLAGPQRTQESLQHLPLLGPADLHTRPSGGDVLARPPRDLADRGRRLPDGLGDLVLRHLEDLAEHEHRPLGRPEGLQHVSIANETLAKGYDQLPFTPQTPIRRMSARQTGGIGMVLPQR